MEMMQIEVLGARCRVCGKYTQYYAKWDGQYMAVDHGFCGQRQCQTRPWNRCKYYRERSSIGTIRKIGTVD